MFPQPHQFINIHTHFKPRDENEFVIRNAFLTHKDRQVPYAVSAGLHPWFTGQYSVSECMSTLEKKMELPDVLAVGEIGLDRVNGPGINQQLPYFEAQLHIAEQFARPVIIHAVRTYSDLLPYLKRSKAKMIIHGFSGNRQQAGQLIDSGALLSFGKSLFIEAHAAVFMELPEGSFLLETDTVRTLRITDVYAKAAAVRKEDPDSLKVQLFHTFAANFVG